MKNSRVKNLTIRVSEEEYNFIQKKAQENRQSPSSYLREKVFFDIPRTEYNSFEYKVLRMLSYCTGISSAIAIGTPTIEQEGQKKIRETRTKYNIPQE
jgi:hypothetical protein